MLSILGQKTRYCDGVSRRGFLKIGGLSFGAGGLSLADLMRAEAATGNTNSHKSVINIFLAGGPPHQDMWDIKTEAPSEIRGEFKPIKTNVPGIEICEVFPKLAGLMDKAAVIRKRRRMQWWTRPLCMFLGLASKPIEKRRRSSRDWLCRRQAVWSSRPLSTAQHRAGQTNSACTLVRFGYRWFSRFCIRAVQTGRTRYAKHDAQWHHLGTIGRSP